LSDDYAVEYYRDAYRDYRAQNPARKFNYYQGLIEQHLSPGMPRRIHDVGCAFGLFLRSLDESWQRHGSDPSAAAIEQASRQLPAAHFIQAAADGEPPAERFSVVTAWDVLEHVPDLQQAGDNISVQLIDGGLLLLVVPVYDGPLGPLVRLLDHDRTHLHKCSRRFWLAWAAQRFELLAWQGIFRYLLPGGYYLHLPSRRLRSIAPAIALVCRQRISI